VYYLIWLYDQKDLIDLGNMKQFSVLSFVSGFWLECRCVIYHHIGARNLVYMY